MLSCFKWVFTTVFFSFFIDSLLFQDRQKTWSPKAIKGYADLKRTALKLCSALPNRLPLASKSFHKTAASSSGRCAVAHLENYIYARVRTKHYVLRLLVRSHGHNLALVFKFAIEAKLLYILVELDVSFHNRGSNNMVTYFRK